MNAPRHSSAKSSVNRDTVFSFTPRGGSGGSATGAGTIANARAAVRLLRLARVLPRFTLGIALLHFPTQSAVAAIARSATRPHPAAN
jgi:hypothetical protein